MSDELRALLDARDIIRKARVTAAADFLRKTYPAKSEWTAWQVLVHAEERLDAQMVELITDPLPRAAKPPVKLGIFERLGNWLDRLSEVSS